MQKKKISVFQMKLSLATRDTLEGNQFQSVSQDEQAQE